MSAGQSVDPTYEVIVIGAGFSGIGAAIKLDEAGFGNFLVVEQSDGVGGAWHANTYPGVAVDIPSFSYSFSFEKNPRWSRIYAPGEELKQYAEHCVDKFGIRGRIRCNTTVVGADFDESKHVWTLRTGSGEELTTRYIVSAVGVLTQLKKPDIDGVDDFDGTLVHTARWDHDLELRGKRVAVIGTGASAVQLVPSIARHVEHLTVFQRTPIWVLPKLDAPLASPVRQVLESVPLAQRGAAGQPCLRRDHLRPGRALSRFLPASRALGRARSAPLAGQAGSRPEGARGADTEVRARLQTALDLEHLSARVQPCEREPADEPDRAHHPERRHHGRR